MLENEKCKEFKTSSEEVMHLFNTSLVFIGQVAFSCLFNKQPFLYVRLSQDQAIKILTALFLDGIRKVVIPYVPNV
jgi:hypothetical protein